MEKKKTLRGVQKRKPTKRSKKKLLKKVGDYLRSDSYMFAPLISSQSKTLRSSAERAEVREPIRENKNKSLIEKIGEYLKSDTYMYAPLVDPPRSISPLPTNKSCDRNHADLLLLTRQKKQFSIKDSTSNVKVISKESIGC
ncbi:hypothetical protein F2P56_025750 [Juglans regia]|uniref:Uncharacterized protein n=2 Tax=Juglans regia TaxID=51240 RepID=A0A833WM84_JUGRE|nr:uncharacterized protein LOC108998919 isoform X3 [Juglans regia]KAF5456248.1 hypothetical protein F2P56_025750 [Juglans regia]